ncbi:ATP-binding cassette domain-containing protein [Azorhizobium doebereinerae]|uniref:ATP-binding cassette domain-containing protein n=1 Tax=Azorhizobium doebereinerae TaxID=281091 RepID=UPI00042120FB|nr:ATP-binding cassette domain-containing protein [Azorhizobium doebereinerae]
MTPRQSPPAATARPRVHLPWAALKPVLALFLAERWPALAGGALLAALTVLAGMTLLSLSGWFIAATAIAGFSAGTALAFDVFGPAAAIRFLALARTGARYGERLVTHEATLGVLAGLREQLFRGWAAPGAARALLARPARVLFRLTEDIDALGQLYLRVLVPAGAAVVAALAAGIALACVTGPLAGAALGGGLLLLGLGLPYAGARAAYAANRRRIHAMEALRARTIDLVAGQTELAMAGRLPAQRRRLIAADAALAQADHALNRTETLVGAGFGIGGAALLAGALLLAGWLAQSGEIGAPVAAAVVLGTLAALEPFAALRRGALELGRTLLASRRLAPRLAPQPAGVMPLAPPAGLAVRLSRVDFRHADAARPAVDDVSVVIEAGARVAVVGASGAGKSSLMALIAGEAVPGEGTVEAVAASTLTQRTELFQDSLRDNLRLAAPAADDAALWAALAAAGLADDVRAMPGGLDARLGEGGLGLSGGQARRLAVARLLLRDTALWLLDEPTEGLDAQTAEGVLSSLAERAGGRTLVVATHIRREAALCDRLLVMAQGRVIARPVRGEPGFDAALAGLRPD